MKVVCFRVHKAGSLPREGPGWGLSLGAPRVLQAPGRDNGLQHLALPPPHEYLLCFLEWGALFVSAQAQLEQASSPTCRDGDPTLRLMPGPSAGQGQRPLQAWVQVLPPGAAS